MTGIDVLSRTGRIFAQHPSFSVTFCARNRVTPFDVFKKRRTGESWARPWSCSSTRGPSTRGSLWFIDYERVTNYESFTNRKCDSRTQRLLNTRLDKREKPIRRYFAMRKLTELGGALITRILDFGISLQRNSVAFAIWRLKL